MTGFVLSPRARRDMDSIWTYTVRHWDEDQAAIYVQRIKASVEALAANPRLGRTCDDIRKGYFRYPVGSHILFYRLTTEGIDIVRILHERMDVGRHL